MAKLMGVKIKVIVSILVRVTIRYTNPRSLGMSCKPLLTVFPAKQKSFTPNSTSSVLGFFNLLNNWQLYANIAMSIRRRFLLMLSRKISCQEKTSS